MSEYYAVMPNDEYLAHYGVKGMKWGKHKAKELYRVVFKKNSVKGAAKEGTNARYRKGSKSGFNADRKSRYYGPFGELGKAARSARSARSDILYEKDTPRKNKEERRERVTNPEMYVNKRLNRMVGSVHNHDFGQAVWDVTKQDIYGHRNDPYFINQRREKNVRPKGSNYVKSPSAGKGTKSSANSRTFFRTRKRTFTIKKNK